MATLKERAIDFATEAHSGQIRKLSKKPYIEHPLQVARTLEEANFSEEVVVAGILHDTVEDTPVTIKQIEDQFGPKVAFYVASHTEDKSKSWEERKAHTQMMLMTAPLEVKALVVADKLDNLRSMKAGYEETGEAIWKNFKRGKEKQRWYINGIIENCTTGLSKEQIPSFFYDFMAEAKEFLC